jgi:perosamine synthetase
MGLVQLKKLDRMNQRRHQIFATYNEALKDLEGVVIPIEKDHVKSSHHIYCLKVRNRDELISHLKENDIAPGVHYFPCHLHSCYKDMKAELPVTERVWETLLSLPMYPGLKEDEVQRVIQGVRSFYE